MLGRAPLPEPGAPPSHLSSRPGHVPRSGSTGWAGTYAGSSVPRRAAVAGSAQARLRGRRAARARRPGGLPAGGGQRRGERGTRGGWRLGDGRRGRPARRMRAGAGGPLLCGNNNVSCHPAAARPAPPSSGPRPGEGRPLGVRPPSVLPSLRPGPQRPGTWRRRCPIVPRRCRPVPGLRRPRGCLQPPRLPAPRPRPRCHGNRAGPPSPGCGRRPARGADSSHALGLQRADWLCARGTRRRARRSWNSAAAALDKGLLQCPQSASSERLAFRKPSPRPHLLDSRVLIQPRDHTK